MTSGKPSLAIIGGTGALGSGLAYRLAAAGYPVIIGSRTVEKARETARAFSATSGSAPPTGAANEDAANAAEIVLLAVPWSSHAEILRAIAPYVGGKLVVDATVPLVPPKVARVQLPPEDSAAVAAQK